MTVRDYLLTEYANASADYKKARDAVDGSMFSSALFEPSQRLDRIRTLLDILPLEIMSAKMQEDNHNDDI